MARRTCAKSNFNSRPSARGDKSASRPTRASRISIHAPPRGATQTSSATSRRKRYFNSRPSARGDHALAQRHRLDKFQFTPLREGRRILFPPTVLFSNFNSRPSARGDTRNRRHCWQWQRFQFTPLREGRHLTLEEAYNAAIFQFTPLREGRHSLVSADTRFPIFQFTPLREGRHCTERSLKNSMYISIHAPPRGATRGARGFRVSGGGISIHAPPRGATGAACVTGKACVFQFTPLREGRQAIRRGRLRR